MDRYVVAHVRERLGRHDLADLLPTAADAAEVKAVNAEIGRVRTRLTRFDDDYDIGLIEGQRHKIATEKARAELVVMERRLARLTDNSGVAPILTAPDPVAAYDTATLMMKRAVVGVLCTVELLPAPRGSRTFRPETVIVTPRGGAGDSTPGDRQGPSWMSGYADGADQERRD